MTRVVIFDTTHHALWAEQVARELRLGAQVVPAPAESDAKCELALEVLEDDFDALRTALEERRIEHRVWKQVL